jgi:hypothetical protein
MNNRKALQQLLHVIAIAAFLMGCKFLASGLSTPTPDQAAQPGIPDGWKLSEDPSRRCQAATPPDWELGHDFFLTAQEPDPGPFADHPGLFPPIGEALWQDVELPEGKLFQIRASLVLDEVVCSVGRIQAEVDFTDAEKSELEQIGKTLQEVP